MSLHLKFLSLKVTCNTDYYVLNNNIYICANNNGDTADNKNMPLQNFSNLKTEYHVFSYTCSCSFTTCTCIRIYLFKFSLIESDQF